MGKDDSRPFIYIHVLSRNIETIEAVQGNAFWMNEEGDTETRIKIGDTIHRDDLMYVEAGGSVAFSRGEVCGGNRGKTHSFVDPASLRSSRNGTDVAQLVEELEDLKAEETDPFESMFPLRTRFELSYAHDFALQNFEVMAARSVSESIARSLQLICLFVAGESACVAMSKLNITRMQAVITALNRPIKPHLVRHHEEEVWLCSVRLCQCSSSGLRGRLCAHQIMLGFGP